jgi:hypothetical protein
MARYFVSTDAWTIELPSDWVEVGKTGPDGVYFESRDGTKGVYVSACRVEDGPLTVQEVAASFRSAGLASLREMQDYAWVLVGDEGGTEEDAAVRVTDAHAEKQGYRIVCKVLAELPVVVSAAFHDYLCRDLDESQRYFAPMVASLRMLGKRH